jgi:hypothetical protein
MTLSDTSATLEARYLALEERATALLVEKGAAEAEVAALRRVAAANRAAEAEVDSLRARLASSPPRDKSVEAVRAEQAMARGEGPAVASASLGELHRLLEEAQRAVQRLQARVEEKQEEERTCSICLGAPKDTVIDPCGHVACAACARQLTACHICRGPIAKLLRTYS